LELCAQEAKHFCANATALLIDVDDGVAKATIGGAMQYTQTEEAPKTSSLILKEEEQNAYQ